MRMHTVTNIENANKDVNNGIKTNANMNSLNTNTNTNIQPNICCMYVQVLLRKRPGLGRWGVQVQVSGRWCLGVEPGAPRIRIRFKGVF